MPFYWMQQHHQKLNNWRGRKFSIRKIKNSLCGQEPNINCNTNIVKIETREQFIFIYYCVTFCRGSTHYWQATMQPQTQLFSRFSKRLLFQCIFDFMWKIPVSTKKEIIHSSQSPLSVYKYLDNWYFLINKKLSFQYSTHGMCTTFGNKQNYHKS